jgi:hypothetical protein
VKNMIFYLDRSNFWIFRLRLQNSCIIVPWAVDRRAYTPPGTRPERDVQTGLAFLFLLLGEFPEFLGSRDLILEVQAFPLPVDFPAIEVTLVAFVASVRNDAQSLA